MRAVRFVGEEVFVCTCRRTGVRYYLVATCMSVSGEVSNNDRELCQRVFL